MHIVLITIAIIIAALGMLIMYGRGDGLIAGYNTLPETKRKRINPRLARITAGIFSLLMALLLVAVALWYTPETQASPPAVTKPRPRIGLVLGGGGAKGAAEIGVLKVLEEEGIHIDYIAGTSIGSIIGGLYSVGYRAADLDSLFHQQAWLDLLSDRKNELATKLYEEIDGVSYVFGFPILRRTNKESADDAPPHTKTVGLLHGDNIAELLDSMTGYRGDIDFNTLPIPFACVAVDIRTMEEVVMTHGSLPTAMRASMAIPGAFKPVEMDSMLLVDGGVLNNLPADIVHNMGADIIIAVDLTQHKREPREDYDRASGNTLGRIIGWLAHRPDLIKYNENQKLIDIYINPDLSGYDAASFTKKKIADMINRGEEAALGSLEQIRELREL